MPLAFKGSVMNPAPGRNPARFGEIPGFPVGSRWPGRRELCDDGVHAHLSNGIHGRGSIGAYSIVLSGGYEDDIDKGDKFTYTGQGGQARRDKGSGEKWSNAQIRNQEWTLGNLSLKTSCKTGTPVRVIRGSGLKSDYAPAVGYRYDGLYTVMKAEMKKGKSGFDICSFRFQRCPGQDPLPGLTATRPMRRERPHEFKSSAPPMPVASSSRIKSPVASTSNTGANSTIKRRALSFSSLFTNSSIRHPRPKHRSHPQPSVADYKSARPQAYQSSCKVEPSSPGPLNTPDSSDWEDSSSSGSQSPEPLRSVQGEHLHEKIPSDFLIIPCFTRTSSSKSAAQS
ncbi:PUA-like domain-containing protein [Flammula alnicola]|nr:PUA-like domain-containing protein [Flammula alnicola]